MRLKVKNKNVLHKVKKHWVLYATTVATAVTATAVVGGNNVSVHADTTDSGTTQVYNSSAAVTSASPADNTTNASSQTTDSGGDTNDISSDNNNSVNSSINSTDNTSTAISSSTSTNNNSNNNSSNSSTSVNSSAGTNSGNNSDTTNDLPSSAASEASTSSDINSSVTASYSAYNQSQSAIDYSSIISSVNNLADTSTKQADKFSTAYSYTYNDSSVTNAGDTVHNYGGLVGFGSPYPTAATTLDDYSGKSPVLNSDAFMITTYFNQLASNADKLTSYQQILLSDNSTYKSLRAQYGLTFSEYNSVVKESDSDTAAQYATSLDNIKDDIQSVQSDISDTAALANAAFDNLQSGSPVLSQAFVKFYTDAGLPVPSAITDISVASSANNANGKSAGPTSSLAHQATNPHGMNLPSNDAINHAISGNSPVTPSSAASAAGSNSLSSSTQSIISQLFRNAPVNSSDTANSGGPSNTSNMTSSNTSNTSNTTNSSQNSSQISNTDSQDNSIPDTSSDNNNNNEDNTDNNGNSQSGNSDNNTDSTNSTGNSQSDNSDNNTANSVNANAASDANTDNSNDNPSPTVSGQTPGGYGLISTGQNQVAPNSNTSTGATVNPLVESSQPNGSTTTNQTLPQTGENNLDIEIAAANGAMDILLAAYLIKRRKDKDKHNLRLHK